MKRFFIMSLSLLMCLGVFGASAVFAQPESNVNDHPQNEVKLTDQQKKELDKLYSEMLETKKKLIKKYVDFGVISQEKADKKLEHIDQFYSKIKENNYIPKYNHFKKKHHNYDE